MAVDLSKLVSKRKLAFEEMRGKSVAIDAFNVLYQFLSIIRQPDGTPLMDSNGNITSHLSGIFYRTTELLEYGIKPIYVFDGIPSILKQKTIMARMKRKEDAHKAWQEARESGDVEAMRIHAQASVKVDKNIVASSKELLDYMGVGYLDAPSEGEAQASYMSKKGLVYAAASQDYDTLLFGSRYVARNLTFSGKRKLPRRNVYINVEPELLSLNDTLRTLGINQKQLIWIGIMLGTDFDEGIKGAGPKTALKIAKGSSTLEDMKTKIKEKFKAEFELDVREVEDLFLNPEIKELDERQIEALLGKQYDKEKLVGFMSEKHGFSNERTAKVIDRLSKIKTESRQKGIGNWF